MVLPVPVDRVEPPVHPAQVEPVDLLVLAGLEALLEQVVLPVPVDRVEPPVHPAQVEPVDLLVHPELVGPAEHPVQVDRLVQVVLPRQ